MHYTYEDDIILDCSTPLYDLYENWLYMFTAITCSDESIDGFYRVLSPTLGTKGGGESARKATHKTHG